ncbi:MAG: PH domain-containing protein, partial [Lachnospiraceae bacterium]|nr:PH domain-containing protein [Lachnospiraceae bacterium]
INSSFLGVITKRARVDVVNIGGDAGDNIGHRILLYNKVPELMRKLKLLMPEFRTIDKIAYERQPLRVLIRDIIEFSFFFWLIGGGCLLFIYHVNGVGKKEVIDVMIPVLVEVITYLIALLGCIMSYRRKGLYYDDLYLVVVSGVFTRSIQVIPYERIQQIQYFEGPIRNLLGVKSANINIQGSALGLEIISTGCFPKERFLELEEYLKKTY